MRTYKSLNPFGTGQCLSTKDDVQIEVERLKSQSLWNRAMSFDKMNLQNMFYNQMSQSLWNRAMSFDLTILLMQ